MVISRSIHSKYNLVLPVCIRNSPCHYLVNEMQCIFAINALRLWEVSNSMPHTSTLFIRLCVICIRLCSPERVLKIFTVVIFDYLNRELLLFIIFDYLNWEFLISQSHISCYSWQILDSPKLVLLTAQKIYQPLPSVVLQLFMMNLKQTHNHQQKETSAKSIQLLAPLTIWHLRYFSAWDMVIFLLLSWSF